MIRDVTSDEYTYFCEQYLRSFSFASILEPYIMSAYTKSYITLPFHDYYELISESLCNLSLSPEIIGDKI
jgi:hypothetical protein